LRELPDVATWIGKARRADSPYAVHRAIYEFHPAGFQVGTRGIDIIDRNGRDDNGAAKAFAEASMIINDVAAALTPQRSARFLAVESIREVLSASTKARP
jgi:hypothetical protein